MAFVYPESATVERQQSVLNYLHGMSVNLPCPGCSHHCQEYLKEHPPTVESRQALFKYLVDKHNDVNTRLGKRTWTYQEVEEDLTAKVVNVNHWMDLQRCEQIQLEDHRKINELKAGQSSGMSTYEYVTVGLSVLALVVVSALLMVEFFRQKRRADFGKRAASAKKN